jgi:hypothetical protein
MTYLLLNSDRRRRDAFTPVSPPKLPDTNQAQHTRDDLSPLRVCTMLSFPVITFVEGNEDAGGSRGRAPFLTSALDVSSQLHDLATLSLVSIVEEGGCAAEPVWTL